MADKFICGAPTSRFLHSCGKPVWKERPDDGRCKNHHPDTIRAAQEARQPRRKLEQAVTDWRLDLRSAETKLLAALVGTEEAPLAEPPNDLIPVRLLALTVIGLRQGLKRALADLTEFDAQLKKRGVKP